MRRPPLLEDNAFYKHALGLVNGFTPALNQKFFILEDTGTGLTSGSFANASSVAGVGVLVTDAAGNTFLLNYADHDPADLSNPLPNDVSLTYLGVNAAVPEPGTWAMMLLGLLGGGLGLLGAGGRRQRHLAAAHAA